MKKSIVGALALSVIMSGTRARAQAAQAEAEPRLQGSGLSGKIEVSEPNRDESVPGRALPFVRPGSIVRVSSGAASSVEASRWLASWQGDSKTVAQAMIEKYGPPSYTDADRLSWDGSGVWKRTSVFRAPRAGSDVLEQTIRYVVPADKREELAKLDLMLSVSPINEELSATSESEATNFLAINLADEVVRGRKTPEEARAFYLSTVKLSAAGKTSPYSQGLLFKP